MNITLAIVTKNRYKLLKKYALSGIYNISEEGFPIILIDQSEGLETQKLVNNIKGLSYYKSDTGLSLGRNMAMNKCKTKYIAYTDDDIIFDIEWLKMMETAFSNGEDIKGVYGRGVWENGVVMPGGQQGVHQWPTTPFHIGSGYNMAFNLKFLKKIEGFNTIIGPGTMIVGGEDTEVIIKILYSGNKVYCTDDAKIIHPEWRDFKGEIKRQWGYGAGAGAITSLHYSLRLLVFSIKRLSFQFIKMFKFLFKGELRNVIAAISYVIGFMYGIFYIKIRG